MPKSFPITLGLTLGGFAGLWHIVWSFFVAVGWAGPIINWIIKMHFINFSYTISPFNFGKALGLVIVTALIGFAVGYVAGLIWSAAAK